MSIQTVIFDLDDTLIVDELVSQETLQQIAEIAKLHFCVDPVRFVADVIQFAHQIWKKSSVFNYCHSIGISAFECLWGEFLGDSQELSMLSVWSKQYRKRVFFESVLAQKNFVTEQSTEFLSSEFSRLRRKNQRLMTGARELLTQLSPRYSIGLLTNGAPDLQREKIVASGLEKFFNYTVISGEYGQGKPNAGPFHYLLSQLRISNTQAVMVGNSMERDIMGAKNSEIISIWLQVIGSEERADIKPDYTVTSLLDIPSILASL